MTMNLQIDGASPLTKLMKKFPERIRRDIINAGAARGATVVKQQAKKNLKQNGSYETGTLYKAIKTKKKKGAHGIYHVFVDKSGWYAHLVEFGHAGVMLKKPIPFEITPGVWITLSRTGTAPAKPFMRPAMEDNKVLILAEIQKRIAKRMAAEAVKMRQSYRTLKKSYRKKLAK